MRPVSSWFFRGRQATPVKRFRFLRDDLPGKFLGEFPGVSGQAFLQSGILEYREHSLILDGRHRQNIRRPVMENLLPDITDKPPKMNARAQAQGIRLAGE